MRLDQIIQGMAIVDRRGRLDVDIGAITADSRRAGRGTLFVAVRGQKADGHRFIADAIERGAAAVLAEEWPTELDKKLGANTPVVLVESTRRALALVAANFHGQPSRKLLIAGVTGTNGKTTVTYMLESIIRASGRSVGVIGTVEARWGEKRVPVEHTTPDPVVLHGLLAQMVADGVSHVVMEISSHALDQHRVAQLALKVGGFTNLTQDHLDYHGDMERYGAAKRLLFSDVLHKSRARGRMAVVNADDPAAEGMAQAFPGKTLRVSMRADAEADVCLVSSRATLDGTEAQVRTPKGTFTLRMNLVGAHNVSNALVATGMALAMGFSRARIERGLADLPGVPGRLERVPSPDGRTVFVDYAHTPDGLRNVISALRPLVSGRVIVVFGCGGDRDKEKRPKMGRVVAELADLAVVTNDNPRTERPEDIARQVEEGLRDMGWLSMGGEVRPKSYLVELDRRAAIRHAIQWLGKDDLLLVAGKGHETYQIVGADKRSFDDREEARRLLLGLPPPPPEPIQFPDTTGELDDDQLVEVVSAIESKSDTYAPLTVDLRTDDALEEVEAAEVVEANEAAGPPGDQKT